MNLSKPMLASDWDESKVKFPVMVQPKIDGVRGLNLGLGLTGRSLKRHANVHATNFFSQTVFRYFDGEMAAFDEHDAALCRLTTSALNTITGEPWLLWHVFDYLAPEVLDKPYEERYGAMKRRYWEIYQQNPEFAAHLKIVPCEYALNMDMLIAMDEKYTQQGYEGTILRDPHGLYKNGRSTAREGGLLRIKRFVEKEFRITGIEEGQRNENEAETNELGYIERSTHQANMTPNGMVGAFTGVDLETGQPIKVAAGRLPHDLRKLWFEQQHLILQKIGKYKTFLKGVKDKPRFPTFQTLRAESDM